jgi:hypothetical protein
VLRSMTVVVTASAALIAASAAFGHGPAAHASASCAVGSGQHVYGYTYLFPIKVSHTNCSTGKNVVKHHGHVNGWHCSTKTLASSPTQVQAKETCKNGRKSVVWTYAQNK